MDPTPRSTLGGTDDPSSPPPPPPSSERPLTARRTFVALIVILAFAFSLLFFYTIRQVIAWLLIAILLAVALNPFVAWLAGHRWPRWLAALSISFLVFVVAVGILAGLTAPFIAQAEELITSIPEYVRNAFQTGPLRSLDERFGIYEQIQQIEPADVLGFVTGRSGSIFQVLSAGASLVFTAVTVFTLMVMLLIEGPRTWGGFVRFFGGERRAWVDRVGNRMGKSVGGYVLGNLAISVIAAVTTYVVLLILDVPYRLPLALLVGLLDIIPLIGAAIGAVICALVAFTVGWVPGVVVIVYFIVYQQIENSFIQPVVYSRTVSMTPLTVLLASLVGGTIAGILGVLVAIPLASALLILIDEYQARRGAVAGWEILEPLERVEAKAPDAEEVMRVDVQTAADEAAEAREAAAGEAAAGEEEDPAAEPGPPERIREADEGPGDDPDAQIGRPAA
jgi:predicted PurR-regulated permease PerM